MGGGAAELEGRGGQHLAHQRRVVMIPRQAIHRHAEVPQQFLETPVAVAALVLDKVAGREDQVRLPRIGAGMGEGGYQRVISVDTAHPRIAPGMQVRIGDVQDAQWKCHGRATTVALFPRFAGDDAGVIAARARLAATLQELRLEHLEARRHGHTAQDVGVQRGE